MRERAPRRSCGVTRPGGAWPDIGRRLSREHAPPALPVSRLMILENQQSRHMSTCPINAVDVGQGVVAAYSRVAGGGEGAPVLGSTRASPHPHESAFTTKVLTPTFA